MKKYLLFPAIFTTWFFVAPIVLAADAGDTVTWSAPVSASVQAQPVRAMPAPMSELPAPQKPPAYMLDKSLPQPTPIFDDQNIDHSNQNQLLKTLKKRGIILTAIKVPDIGMATDLNNKGQITGSYNLNEHYTGDFFIWEKGKFKKVGTGFGNPFINDRGQVVYSYYNKDGSSPSDLVSLWQNGKTTGVNFPPEVLSLHVEGLNNQGRVLVEAAEAAPGGNSDDAVFYGFSNLDGVTKNWGEGQILGQNDQGQMVGFGGRKRAMLWNDNGSQELGVEGLAYDINNKGKVVGSALESERLPDSPNVAESFIWDNGAITNIDFYEAVSINNNDEVVGNARLTATKNNLNADKLAELGIWEGARHPIYWKNGAMVDLNDLLPVGYNVELLKAIKINDRHQILVMGVKGRQQEKVYYLLTLK